MRIEWIKTVDRQNAKPATKAKGLFSTQLVKASLQGQLTTVQYLTDEFEIDFGELLS